MRNKKYKRYKSVIAAALCGVMMTGLVGCGNVPAQEKNVAETPAVLSEEDEELAEVIENSLGIATAGDSDKDETVYVIADAEGKKQEVIVSAWLKNPNGEAELQDVSNLNNIYNVKGEETFTQNGTDVTWQADGNPIYYQGTSDAELPVGVEISYYLEGEKVTPEEIAGKSGKVKIRFDYINNEKTGDVYAPFLMATGMILDNENFSNVSVENGKVVSDGNRSIVVGMGFPGLEESLGLSDSDIELPDYCEVTADATNFSLDMTVTFAATGFLGETEESADFDDIEETVDDLVTQYQDGVNALADGIVQYTDGVAELADGAKQLDDGAKQIYTGTVSLGNGVSSAKEGAGQVKGSFEGESGILAGSKQLSAGLDALNQAVSGISLPAGTPELTPEQKQAVVDTVTANITNNLTQNKDQIAAGVDQNAVMAEAQQNGAAAAPSQDAVVAEAMSKAPSKDQISAEATNNFAQFAAAYQQQTGQQLDDATLQALAAAYGAAYETAYQSAYGSAYGTAYQSAYTAGYGSAYGTAYQSGYGSAYVRGYQEGYSEAFQSGIMYGANLVLAQVSAYTEQLNTLKTSVAALSAGAAKLDAGLNQLYGGVDSLYNGMVKLDNGADELTGGAKDLKNGANELQAGTGKLTSASGELVDGSVQLADGTEKIVEAINNAEIDVEDFADHLKTIINAGSAYQSFGGISDDMTGNVKFIIKTDAVKAE